MPEQSQLVHQLVQRTDELTKEVKELQKNMHTAFVKDEEGVPDYTGHRRHHLKEMKTDDAMSGVKIDFVKHLFRWGSAGLFSILVYAFTMYVKGGA